MEESNVSVAVDVRVEPGSMAPAYNARAQETEAGPSPWAQGQPAPHAKALWTQNTYIEKLHTI